jgi:hypothetical protein
MSHQTDEVRGEYTKENPHPEKLPELRCPTCLTLEVTPYLIGTLHYCRLCQNLFSATNPNVTATRWGGY